MIASGSKSGFLFFILIFSLLKNRVSGSLSTICSICPGLEGGIISKFLDVFGTYILDTSPFELPANLPDTLDFFDDDDEEEEFYDISSIILLKEWFWRD